MKFIPLTQGKLATVDDEDYEWLNQWKWYANRQRHTQNFYAVRQETDGNGKRRTVSMAREILRLKQGDKRQPDHKDHNTLDNRKSFLRIVTHQQNQWNKKTPKGYTWKNRDKKYQAQLTLNGKTRYLGYFDDAKQAHNAYLMAKEKCHNF